MSAGPSAAQISEQSVVSARPLHGKHADCWDSRPELPPGLSGHPGTVRTSTSGEKAAVPRLAEGERWEVGGDGRRA